LTVRIDAVAIVPVPGNSLLSGTLGIESQYTADNIRPLQLRSAAATAVRLTICRAGMTLGEVDQSVTSHPIRCSLLSADPQDIAPGRRYTILEHFGRQVRWFGNHPDRPLPDRSARVDARRSVCDADGGRCCASDRVGAAAKTATVAIAGA